MLWGREFRSGFRLSAPWYTPEPKEPTHRKKKVEAPPREFNVAVEPAPGYAVEEGRLYDGTPLAGAIAGAMLYEACFDNDEDIEPKRKPGRPRVIKNVKTKRKEIKQ